MNANVMIDKGVSHTLYWIDKYNNRELDGKNPQREILEKFNLLTGYEFMEMLKRLVEKER